MKNQSKLSPSSGALRELPRDGRIRRAKPTPHRSDDGTPHQDVFAGWLPTTAKGADLVSTCPRQSMEDRVNFSRGRVVLNQVKMRCQGKTEPVTSRIGRDALLTACKVVGRCCVYEGPLRVSRMALEAATDRPSALAAACGGPEAVGEKASDVICNVEVPEANEELPFSAGGG